MARSIGPAPSRSLAGIRILESVPDSVRAEIAARCQWTLYEDGEEIVAYLDGQDDVYFMVSGRGCVVIYSACGKAVAFRDIEEGGLFGEYAAIDHKPRSASVEAYGPCCVARLPAADFLALLRSEPSFAEALLAHLVDRIRELTERVVEFSTLPVKTRIRIELLRLAGNPPSDSPPCVIRPFPTHGTLAVHVSTHREAVSRELGRLAKAGLVAREGRSLKILDVAALRRMVRAADPE